MIPLVEISRAASHFQVSAETIEKDYIISWILFCLSKSQLKNKFIFYGGTAIKRIYFADHRFSEDIDLISSNDFNHDSLLQSLDMLRYAREKANIELEIDSKRIVSAADRMQIFVRYSGYDEITGAPKEIRIDFSMNRRIDGDVENKGLILSYSDLTEQTVVLPVMSLNTIFANKLGLLIDRTRNEPRDFFDIWFLLQHTKQLNFEKICKIFKDKYGFSLSLSVLRPCLQSCLIKNKWNLRLSAQVANLPDIEMVMKNIVSHLEKLFNN